jgi:protein-S-isoprenylcysteine O-methyltransferase Ste14
MPLLKLIYWAGILAQIAVRSPLQKVWRNAPKKEQRVSGLERGLLSLLLVGGFIFPLIYSVTSWLAFADYALSPWLGWLGVVLMAVAVILFWRAHADLKTFWSPSLEIFKDHKLMTNGLYGLIRHPMYASQWAFCLAQALLLQNWIAGPAGLVTFSIFYFLRVRAEEQMMIDAFGDEYRAYMKKTGRVFPRLGSR